MGIRNFLIPANEIIKLYNLPMLKSIFNSQSFWENFIANLLADAIVAFLIGFLLVWWINRRDKKSEKLEEEKNLKEKLKVEVNMIWGEIEYNRNQLKVMISNLPKANFIFPALEVSAWNILDKSFVRARLKVKDFADILHIYNRVKTINKMYYLMLEQVNWIEEGEKRTVKKFYIDAIVDRCKELLSYIEEVFPEEIINKKIKN